MIDWQLEFDCDNEIYTEGDISDELLESTIERDLKRFDGVKTYYCGLSDPDDETVLRCLGEPDRRIIEANLFGDMLTRFATYTFVLASRKNQDDSPVTIKLGNDVTLDVKANEIVTLDQAIAIFKTFCRTKTIHEDYMAIPKTYGQF